MTTPEDRQDMFDIAQALKTPLGDLIQHLGSAEKVAALVLLVRPMVTPAPTPKEIERLTEIATELLG